VRLTASAPCVEYGRWADDLYPERCGGLRQRGIVGRRGRRARQREDAQVNEELLEAAGIATVRTRACCDVTTCA
jgi:hypothetical protein